MNYLLIVILSLVISSCSYAESLSNQLNTLLLEKSPKPVQQSYTATPVSHYALILFYESTCPHCRRFSPIIQDFSTQNHIPVYAFTIDGQTLPEWPRSVPANDALISAFFGQSSIVVPTTFLVNVNTLHTTLIGSGEMSEEELAQSVLQATRDPSS